MDFVLFGMCFSVFGMLCVCVLCVMVNSQCSEEKKIHTVIWATLLSLQQNAVWIRVLCFCLLCDM